MSYQTETEKQQDARPPPVEKKHKSLYLYLSHDETVVSRNKAGCKTMSNKSKL